VPHIHFHVIPRFSDDHHSWNWKQNKYDTSGEMQEYADKIQSSL
jgi:diadenosine tetraphosphate (Ap4A) HIT family hydrolase